MAVVAKADEVVFCFFDEGVDFEQTSDLIILHQLFLNITEKLNRLSNRIRNDEYVFPFPK